MYAIAYVAPGVRAELFTHANVHELSNDDETRTCEFPAVHVGKPVS